MTIHRPPMPRPPQWQDDCGCGDQWSNIQQCWNEIEQLKLLLRQVIEDMGPLAVSGSTDGGEAGTGMIGEYLFSTNATDNNGVTIPVTQHIVGGASAYTTIGSLVVPPGDWDVRGSISIAHGSVAPNATWFQFTISPSEVNPPTDETYWPQGWFQMEMSPMPTYIEQFLGSIRINSTVPKTILMRGNLLADANPTGNGAAWYNINARRMR